MKTTKEMIEVMRAYDMGEQIQILNIEGNWEDKDSPVWNWAKCDYRVKPKTKYIPFDTPEEFLAAQREHGGGELISIEDETMETHDVSVMLDGNVYEHIKGDCLFIGNLGDLLLEDYKFVDGTPCGKEVTK